MTRYLIIDDEPIAHDIIMKYCDMLPNMHFEKSCYDAIEALEYLKGNSVDLIFLDLNMPKLKGFPFLKTLINPPQVIVTTAYKEFALEGYELNIVDYLLKPFSFERFLLATQKLHQPKKNNIEKSESKDESKSIFLRSNKKYIQIEINKILFLESAGNYVKVVLSKETIVVRDKISELLKEISSPSFVKVHKSFAISKTHIKSIEGNRIFIDEYEIPIGKLYKEEIKNILK